jgi:hypothetical protein
MLFVIAFSNSGLTVIVANGGARSQGAIESSGRWFRAIAKPRRSARQHKTHCPADNIQTKIQGENQG